jgi:hypothetical protein
MGKKKDTYTIYGGIILYRWYILRKTKKQMTGIEPGIFGN